MEDLVKAAKDYDFYNRPQRDWKSVPDSQVARLLVGAKIAIEGHIEGEVRRIIEEKTREQRQATPVTGGG
jgi:hypothetical protein